MRGAVVGDGSPAPCGLANDHDIIRLYERQCSQCLDCSVDVARRFQPRMKVVGVLAATISLRPLAAAGAVAATQREGDHISARQEPLSGFLIAAPDLHFGPRRRIRGRSVVDDDQACRRVGGRTAHAYRIRLPLPIRTAKLWSRLSLTG